ncbi:MAG: hypothetical protein ACI3YA_05155 [Alloprevotella sp.]
MTKPLFHLHHNPTIINDTHPQTEIEQFNLALIADFFKRLPRQGPGCDAQTRRFTDRQQEEMDFYRAHQDCFGYAFFVGSKV